jgi:hypothetical protein
VAEAVTALFTGLVRSTEESAERLRLEEANDLRQKDFGCDSLSVFLSKEVKNLGNILIAPGPLLAARASLLARGSRYSNRSVMCADRRPPEVVGVAAPCLDG